MKMAELCPFCGGLMKQTGADLHTAYYKCASCGNTITKTLENDSNAEYHIQRSELVRRINQRLLDSKISSWEFLRKDIIDFMGKYQAANQDITLQMGLIMCVTNGFSTMDAAIYKSCKTMYKTTEKLSKSLKKKLKSTNDSEFSAAYDDYQNNRKLYKNCRNDYRNTKFMWKGILFIAKRIVLK